MPAAGRVADRHQPQAREPKRLELILIGRQQPDHIARFAPAGIQRHSLRSQRRRFVVEETNGYREHPLVSQFDKKGLSFLRCCLWNDHEVRGWFIGTSSGYDKIELRVELG